MTGNINTSKCPKYITVNPSDRGYGTIDSDKELETWLKDGSLEEGHIVYEVANVRTVEVSDPALMLSLKEKAP